MKEMRGKCFFMVETLVSTQSRGRGLASISLALRAAFSPPCRSLLVVVKSSFGIGWWTSALHQPRGGASMPSRVLKGGSPGWDRLEEGKQLTVPVA